MKRTPSIALLLGCLSAAGVIFGNLTEDGNFLIDGDGTITAGWYPDSDSNPPGIEDDYNVLIWDKNASSLFGGYQPLELFDDSTDFGAWSISYGTITEATGVGSFAFGNSVIASGSYSVGIGYEATASHAYSYALGKGITSSAVGQFVIGQYNLPFSSGVFVVGGGISAVERENLFSVDNSGNVWLSGDLSIDGYATNLKVPPKGGISMGIFTSE